MIDTLAKRINGFKGDTLDIQLTVGEDITGWGIRCEIWDSTKPTNLFLQKGSAIVSGGSASEIEFSSPTTGIFVIHVLAGETTSFKGDINIEVEVTNTAGKRTTIYRDSMDLSDEKITWTATS